MKLNSSIIHEECALKEIKRKHSTITDRGNMTLSMYLAPSNQRKWGEMKKKKEDDTVLMF